MTVLRFELSSGRLVGLEAIHMRRTYEQIIEGIPSDEYNAHLIETQATALSTIWGKRRTHIIAPQTNRITTAGRTYNRLPELVHHALLTSDSIDRSRHGSSLVVCWFGPPQGYRETPILELVSRAVSDLSWEQLAEDFDY